jgi:DNA-directed RNA polymerase sigma subunit (sigma70/sigma32)
MHRERKDLKKVTIELHRQGLSYQQIADKYGISRERVRQILSTNPEFEAYRQKQKKKNYR